MVNVVSCPGPMDKLVPISNWYNPAGTAEVGFAMPGRLVLMEP